MERKCVLGDFLDVKCQGSPGDVQGNIGFHRRYLTCKTWNGWRLHAVRCNSCLWLSWRRHETMRRSLHVSRQSRTAVMQYVVTRVCGCRDVDTRPWDGRYTSRVSRVQLSSTLNLESSWHTQLDCDQCVQFTDSYTSSIAAAAAADDDDDDDDDDVDDNNDRYKVI